MKTNKVLRIVIPVTYLERAAIKRAVKTRNGRTETIAGWCREVLLASAKHATIAKGV